MIYKRYVKRILDVILSFVGLIIAAIPMVIVAIIIKLDSKGPVIFKQDRIGYKGKVYKMYKFRSMCVDAEKGGVYSDNTDTRVTKVGSRLSTKEQKNLQRNGNTAFCGVFFLPIFRFCPYYGYQHV